VLRDNDEYVTLVFSGPGEASTTCLDLDLSEQVKEWSRRWLGRRVHVSVRSGSGGATPASGRRTALVTFASSNDACAFCDRFKKADKVGRPFVQIEPYCEQEPLAPPMDSTTPSCRIDLRLYAGQPQSDLSFIRETSELPVDCVAELQHLVRAALRDGVVLQSQQLNQSRRLLYMKFVAVNESG
jgi:hypothetical protein